MSNRSSFVRGLAVALSAAALSGCGDSEAKFAPACPAAAIVADAADLSRYRGTGRDLTDMVLDGRITGVQGQCKRDDATTLATTISVGLDLTRGPAAPGRVVDVAYFVAVSEGDRILDKRVFPLHVEFPANTDRIRLTGDSVDLALPIGQGRTGASFKVYVGFQLSPDELAINRRRGTR